MHLAFFHEHTRQDRDKYVQVIENNIKGYDFHNFRKQKTNSLGSPYDYKSVMHYSPYSSAKVPGTITIKALNGNTIVVSKEASTTDVVQLRLIYQCQSGPRQLSEYNKNICSSDCKCWDGMKGCKGKNEFCQDDLMCVNDKCSKNKNPIKNPVPSPTQPTVPTKPSKNSNYSLVKYDKSNEKSGGVMFDIQAKGNAIEITSFQMNLRKGRWAIDIYTLWTSSGNFREDQKKWTKIKRFRGLYGSKGSEMTNLELKKPQKLQKYSRRGFYITTTKKRGYKQPFRVHYISAKAPDNVEWASDDRVSIKGTSKFNAKFIASGDPYAKAYGVVGGAEYKMSL